MICSRNFRQYLQAAGQWKVPRAVRRHIRKDRPRELYPAYNPAGLCLEIQKNLSSPHNEEFSSPRKDKWHSARRRLMENAHSQTAIHQNQNQSSFSKAIEYTHALLPRQDQANTRPVYPATTGRWIFDYQTLEYANVYDYNIRRRPSLR